MTLISCVNILGYYWTSNIYPWSWMYFLLYECVWVWLCVCGTNTSLKEIRRASFHHLKAEMCPKNGNSLFLVRVNRCCASYATSVKGHVKLGIRFSGEGNNKWKASGNVHSERKSKHGFLYQCRLEKMLQITWGIVSHLQYWLYLERSSISMQQNYRFSNDFYSLED